MLPKLNTYNNHDFQPGAGKIKQLLWYYCNALILKKAWMPVSKARVLLLKIFGAKIGSQVVIKPCVNIKYPWKLTIGDHSWIGENVWIDNLATVSVGANVCLSQGALLLTGNHNYKSEKFDLITGSITLEEGTWVGAKSVVCPSTTMKQGSILTVGSVASGVLNAMTIYKGNPAIEVRKRN